MKSEIITNYRPEIDPDEFMNPRQIEYFRAKLVRWRDELLRESETTIENLKRHDLREPDLNDRASSESDWSIELRARDRQRKLIAKIDGALARIDAGEYGYCEVTGEPICVKRLDARPIATMSLEAQEMHERKERIHRDD